MPAFQVRVTRPFDVENAARVSELVAMGGGTQYFVYEHEADEEVSRTHMHIYIFDYSLKEDSLRSRIRQVWNNIDKSDFAVSSVAGRNKGPITFDGAIRYACKNGTVRVKRVRGFSEDAVKYVEDSCVVVPAVKMVRIGFQMRKYQHVKMLQELVLEEEQKQYRTLSMGEVYDIYVNWCKETGQMITEYRVQEVLTTFRTYKSDSEHMRKRILDRLA